jgi:chaperonin cofactor prefoldin
MSYVVYQTRVDLTKTLENIQTAFFEMIMKLEELSGIPTNTFLFHSKREEMQQELDDFIEETDNDIAEVEKMQDEFNEDEQALYDDIIENQQPALNKWADQLF